MRCLLMGLVLLACLAGCSKGSSGTGPHRASNGTVAPIQPERNPVWDQAQPAPEPLYEGQTVLAWAEQFNRTDNPSARAQAAAVLGQAGNDGFKYLLEGMASKSDDLRIIALQSVTQAQLTGETLPGARDDYSRQLVHQQQTMNLLLEMLTSRNAELRKLAVDRLSWYGTTNPAGRPLMIKAVQALRQAAQNDPSPEVRDSAVGSLNQITSAITGKPVAGSPDDPKLPF